MLIYLDNSILDNLNSLNKDEICSLEYIAESTRQGKHVVIGSSKILERLYNCQKLNEKSRTIFRKLYNIRPQLFQIKNLVNIIIEVKSGINSINRIKNINNKVIEVPLSYFDDTSKIEQCYLLCEDLKDCDFYIGLTKYLKEKEACNFKINLNSLSGGGKNTGEVYKNKLNQKSACISIVDSDKDSFESNCKDTAIGVEKKYNDYKDKCLTDLHILEVREKENLLPPHIYLEIEQLEDYKFLKAIYENDKFRDICYYGDIKSGLNSCDRKLKEYLHSELNSLKDENIVDIDFLDNISINSQVNENKNRVCIGVRKCFDTFNKYILEGKLEKDINEANYKSKEYPNIEYHREEYNKLKRRKENIEKCIRDLPSEYKKWWDDIANMCFSWGCAIKIENRC